MMEINWKAFVKPEKIKTMKRMAKLKIVVDDYHADFQNWILELLDDRKELIRIISVMEKKEMREFKKK